MIVDTLSTECLTGKHQDCVRRWLMHRWDPHKEGLSHAHGPREDTKGYCICACHDAPSAVREPGAEG